MPLSLSCHLPLSITFTYTPTLSHSPTQPTQPTLYSQHTQTTRSSSILICKFRFSPSLYTLHSTSYTLPSPSIFFSRLPPPSPVTKVSQAISPQEDYLDECREPVKQRRREGREREEREGKGRQGKARQGKARKGKGRKGKGRKGKGGRQGRAQSTELGR